MSANSNNNHLSDPPASISKEIKPFIARANELATVNLPISYFCQLYAAQLILDKKLHQNNALVTGYISELLDNIEQLKSSASAELLELINNEEKGLAYVQNFAFDVFNNLNNQVETQSVTKATALGFIASISFLQLIKLWKDDDSEVVVDINQRIKYAKFHAARILKSLKNGEDPNEYEPPKPKATNDDDEVEDSIKKLENQLAAEGVEDTTESEPKAVDNVALGKDEDDISHSLKDDFALVEQPSNSSPTPIFPTVSSDLLRLPASTSVSPPSTIPPPATKPEVPPSSISKSPIVPATPAPAKTTLPVQVQRHEPLSKESIHDILEESEVISKAQKHAKYAISALNYEDKTTAIEELRQALSLLEGH